MKVQRDSIRAMSSVVLSKSRERPSWERLAGDREREWGGGGGKQKAET